jgi:hypothetical protein
VRGYGRDCTECMFECKLLDLEFSLTLACFRLVISVGVAYGIASGKTSRALRYRLLTHHQQCRRSARLI